MNDVVPHAVKQYWAEELSSPSRADWITEALKKHFFPMPEYDGAIVSRRALNATTHTTAMSQEEAGWAGGAHDDEGCEGVCGDVGELGGGGEPEG